MARPLSFLEMTGGQVETNTGAARSCFLTTSPNAIVEPIHPKAMPLILTTDEERDVWMRAEERGEGIAASVGG
jgi:putative SOS response-associated peptidase YedK